MSEIAFVCWVGHNCGRHDKPKTFLELLSIRRFTLGSYRRYHCNMYILFPRRNLST